MVVVFHKLGLPLMGSTWFVVVLSTLVAVASSSDILGNADRKATDGIKAPLQKELEAREENGIKGENKWKSAEIATADQPSCYARPPCSTPIQQCAFEADGCFKKYAKLNLLQESCWRIKENYDQVVHCDDGVIVTADTDASIIYASCTITGSFRAMCDTLFEMQVDAEILNAHSCPTPCGFDYNVSVGGFKNVIETYCGKSCTGEATCAVPYGNNF